MTASAAQWATGGKRRGSLRLVGRPATSIARTRTFRRFRWAALTEFSDLPDHEGRSTDGSGQGTGIGGTGFCSRSARVRGPRGRIADPADVSRNCAGRLQYASTPAVVSPVIPPLLGSELFRRAWRNLASPSEAPPREQPKAKEGHPYLERSQPHPASWVSSAAT